MITSTLKEQKKTYWQVRCYNWESAPCAIRTEAVRISRILNEGKCECAHHEPFMTIREL